MKTFLLSIIFLLPSSILLSQTITIGDDDIVRCKDVPIGTTQTIFGDTYEVVDRALLIQRRDEGADLTKVCVSNVTDMSMMFWNTSFNQPIGNWDVSSVTNMGFMLSSSQFNQPIANWDVSSVTNMNGMFIFSQFDQPIDNWDVSNVTNMVEMFVGTPFNQPIGNWDVSSVTTMGRMFINSQFNQPIGNWNVSSVSIIGSMFSNSKFNQPIGNWNVSSVTDMTEMFSNSPFNQPIGNWNVSSVTSMKGMFRNTSFNQPIGDWDVSNVTNMNEMFYFSRFNQPIENWDVSSVTNMSYMFYGGLTVSQRPTSFNQPIENWDVSSVTNMSYMFSNSTFNQPIGNWDVSNVKNMRGMFLSSRFFNVPIGNWDVSNVTDMNSMFSSSREFNQPINKWCVVNFSFEPFDFSTNSLLIPAYKPIWGACPIETPAPLTQIHPNNNTTSVSRILDLNWKSDKLATKYQLQLFEGNDPMVLDTLISDTTYTNQTPLKSNFEYNWRVRGLNENRTINEQPLTGDWSEIWRFTTGFFQAFDLVSPLDSTLLEELSPTFVWNTEPNAEAYEIQISNDEFSTFVVNEVVTDTSYTFQTLSYSTNYQWRVKGINNDGESEWSKAWNFTTVDAPIESIILLFPKNDSSVVEISPTLIWNSEPNSKNYTIQVSTDLFATTLVNEVVTDTTFTTPTLSYSTEYQWRVRGANNAGESEWSTAWNFSVQLPTSNEKENNPNEFVLNQNYPNPFNPTTQIRYGIPQGAEVELSVFNMLGQKIITLVDSRQSAGWHNATFDASGLSSGFYIYRIQAGNFVSTKKLMLIK